MMLSRDGCRCISWWKLTGIVICFMSWRTFCASAVAPEFSCGPVAVKLYCALKGKELSLQETALRLGTTAEGATKLSDMVTVLKDLGFSPVAAQTTFEQLAGIPTPAILPVGDRTVSHFVLLVRRKDTGMRVIWDPGVGEYTFAPDVLQKGLLWTGIVLFDASSLEVRSEASVEQKSIFGGNTVRHLDKSGDSNVVFPITNTTKVPIRILGVTPSCSACVEADRPFIYPPVLEPGQTDTLVVRLNNGRRSVFSGVRLFVQTDSKDSEVQTCLIISRIVTIFPEAVDLAVVDPYEEDTRSISLSYRGSEPLDPSATQLICSSAIEGGGSLPVPIQVDSRWRDSGGYFHARLKFKVANVFRETGVSDGYWGCINEVGRRFRTHLLLQETSGRRLAGIDLLYRLPSSVLAKPESLFLGPVPAGGRPVVASVSVEKPNGKVVFDHAGVKIVGEEACGLALECSLNDGGLSVDVEFDRNSGRWSPGLRTATLVVPYWYQSRPEAPRHYLNCTIPIVVELQ